MKFKNVSPRGDLDLGPTGETVLAGETVDVDDELGVLLADQPENWEPADDVTEKALAALQPSPEDAAAVEVAAEPEGESK